MSKKENAYSEVYWLFQRLSEEEFDKIPAYVLAMLMVNMNRDYKPESTNLSSEAIALYRKLYRDYLEEAGFSDIIPEDTAEAVKEKQLRAKASLYKDKAEFVNYLKEYQEENEDLTLDFIIEEDVVKQIGYWCEFHPNIKKMDTALAADFLDDLSCFEDCIESNFDTILQFFHPECEEEAVLFSLFAMAYQNDVLEKHADMLVNLFLNEAQFVRYFSLYQNGDGKHEDSEELDVQIEYWRRYRKKRSHFPDFERSWPCKFAYGAMIPDNPDEFVLIRVPCTIDEYEMLNQHHPEPDTVPELAAFVRRVEEHVYAFTLLDNGVDATYWLFNDDGCVCYIIGGTKCIYDM